jgi:sugar phosphate isomerase/epimerase
VANQPIHHRPLIAFSTLACPEWDPGQVVEEAAAIGYDAIEWRGGSEGHVRTTWSKLERQGLRRHMGDRGVAALAVTAYTSFVSPDRAARTRSREDLRRHIELASDLGAPFVRAFPGIREDDAADSELCRRIVSELGRVVDEAVEAGIVIAIEQHDDFDRAAQVGAILELLDHPGLGAVWDVANGWAAGEPPEVGLAAIRDRLCYTQLKDGTGPRDDRRATPFGLGDVPLEAAVRCLVALGSPGPISVEWLRAWDAELDPPAVALPESLRYVKAMLASVAPAGQ